MRLWRIDTKQAHTVAIPEKWHGASNQKELDLGNRQPDSGGTDLGKST